MSSVAVQYLVEATLVWAVLLLFYAVVIRRNGNWHLHRRLLLLFLAAGTCLPLLPKVQTEWEVAPASLTEDAVVYVTSTFAGTRSPESESIIWTDILLMVWAAGTLVALSWLTYQTRRHLRRGEWKGERYAGFPVVRSPHIQSPYAAFGRIYLPESLAPDLEHAALLHEAAHIRNGHFTEKLLAAFVVAGFWFHPLPWIYARRLSVVHEYEADAAVAEHLSPASYGELLLRSVMRGHFTTGLFTSPLKNRIAMLQSKLPASSLGRKPATLLAVLGAALVLTCSISRLPSASKLPGETITTAVPADSLWQGQFLAAVYYPEEAFQDAEYDEMARITVDLRILANGKVSRITLKQVALEDKRPEFPTLTVVGDRAPIKDLAIQVQDAPKYFQRAVEQAIQQVSNFPIAEREGRPVASELSFDVFFFPQKNA